MSHLAPSHVPLIAPLGGVERPRRKERFARLIQRCVRVLGGPSVRAASGGNQTPTASLPSVVDQKQEQSEPAGGPVADGAAAVTTGSASAGLAPSRDSTGQQA
jgi:hypothetical protein